MVRPGFPSHDTVRGFLSNPISQPAPSPFPTLPSFIRKVKASEKATIPDTNTIVCTFLLDGVSL